MSSFIEKLQKHAQKQGVTNGIDLGLASSLLANASLSQALSGLKLLAKFKSKPVVRATLVALIETALED